MTFVVCYSVFALPLGVISKQCSVILTFPGHFLHFFYLSPANFRAYQAHG